MHTHADSVEDDNIKCTTAGVYSFTYTYTDNRVHEYRRPGLEFMNVSP